MRTLYQLLVVVLFYLWIGLQGCTLFKKTSKTTTKDQQSSTKQLEMSQLILKRANKETQVFTYWNDSGIYQFQHIKEQADQAKLQQEKTMEKEEAKQESSIKKSQPETLIYSGVVVFLVITYLVYKRFF